MHIYSVLLVHVHTHTVHEGALVSSDGDVVEVQQIHENSDAPGIPDSSSQQETVAGSDPAQNSTQNLGAASNVEPPATDEPGQIETGDPLQRQNSVSHKSTHTNSNEDFVPVTSLTLLDETSSERLQEEQKQEQNKEQEQEQKLVERDTSDLFNIHHPWVHKHGLFHLIAIHIHYYYLLFIIKNEFNVAI